MKPSKTSLLLLSAACLLLHHPAFFVHGQDKCYYPNGALAATDDHPCSSDGYSTCCPLNWQCLSNGLCYLENEGYLGRYTCTDSAWESDNCPNICTHGGKAAGNEAIQKCSENTYCCDANRPEVGCCETSNSNDFFPLPDGTVVASIGAKGAERPLAAQSSQSLIPAVVRNPTSSSSGSPPSSTGTAKQNAKATTSKPGPASSVIFITSVVINSAGVTVTSINSQVVQGQTAPSSASLASSQSSSSSSLGLKIGLGVGIPVGVIGLALLGFFGLRHRSKKSTKNPQMNGSNAMEYMYKGHGDAGAPLMTTPASPDLNKRASSKYVVSDSGEGGYRGVKSGSSSGLGLQPVSPELPYSPTRSELSGDPSASRDYRVSQMSELAASPDQPSELPDRPYR